MGFSPMGGASSYGMSNETFDRTIGRERHNDRNDSDRRKRESTYESQKEQRRREEAERKAREEAERKARVKAKRDEERAEEETVEKEQAQQEKEARSLTSGFSPIGGAESYGLAKGSLLDRVHQKDFSEYGSIHFRQPTEDERKLGYSDNAAFSAQPSHPASKQEVADLAGEVIGENSTNIAAKAIGSAGTLATGIPMGDSIAKAGVELVRSLTTDDTDWQKQVKKDMHAQMESDGLFAGVQSATANGLGIGAVHTGSQTLGKTASIIGNPVMSIGVGVADDAIARENYLDTNSDYLRSMNVDLPKSNIAPSTKESGNGSTGILKRMTPVQPVQNTQQSKSEEVPFQWVTDIDTTWRL